MNAEEIANKIVDKTVKYGGGDTQKMVLAGALLEAIEALETYLQFADNGELALVSGRLARDALAKIREEK